MTDRQCAVCHSDLGDILLVHDKPDRFERAVGIQPEGYRREWRECPTCGLVSNINSAANQQKLLEIGEAYYEVDFGKGSIREKYEFVMALPEAESDNAGRVSRIIQFLDRPDWKGMRTGGTTFRVLDIGAGTGVFLSKLRQVTGWNAGDSHLVAVEPDPHAASHLRDLGGLEVVEGLFDSSTDLGAFELVTLNKVVEHVGDPVELLRDAGSALSEDNGILYVEVPDAMTIGRRDKKDNNLGALHWHLYTPASAIRAIEEAGLVALRAERFADPSGKLSVCVFACKLAVYEKLGARN